MPLLPKRLWTMNRAAQEDSPADVYRFHPWRAPGSAPVTDCCGTAGGTSPKYRGPGEAVFAGVLTLSAAYVLVNEGRDNWQSLWTCAIYLLFGLTLWRARAEQTQE